jgi:RNA polymerase sigma-70 factor, ECF subfamily
MRDDLLDAEEARYDSLREGDEAAFARFMRAHEERVFRIAMRWLGSVEEARDLTQDVFLTLSRKLSQFEGNARLSTWVYRVAVNHAKNRLRYLSRRRARAHDSLDARPVELSDGRLSAALPGPHEVLAARQLAETLGRALETLSPSHRQIVVWRDVEGLTYEQMSARLGLPVGTVKSRLHRGRAQLRCALAALGLEVPSAGAASPDLVDIPAPRAAKR